MTAKNSAIKNMTTKEWLKQGLQLCEEIKSLEDALQNAKANANYTSFFGGERVDTSKENGVENKLMYYLYLERQLKSKISKARDVNCRIFQMISEIENPVVRSVMEAKYIEGQKIYEIANRYGYNVRWVYKLLNKGEKAVEEKLDSCDICGADKSKYM